MARQKPNKSQLVRDYAEANPTATQAEIMKSLTAQGNPVSRALVAQALKSKGRTAGFKKRKKRGTKKTSAPTTVSAVRSQTTAPTDSQWSRLVLAADFSKAVGGIDVAIETLNGLKKVASKL